ncbi:MAG: hypothetical protein JXB30_20275 [Anaerolineae bacterium]|nr:hypothetical protein [Anaerolineae bacterium]
MSEFQYYEWQTVDRTLTSEEQAAVNRLSSHIEVTASRAVVTYSWSNFRHDPKQVLAEYFDAHFYMANWGSMHLMFRFPQGVLDSEAVKPYCVDNCISLEPVGTCHVLEMSFHEEEGWGWIEPGGELSSFVHLRNDLIEGDYRLLYLAWLKAVESGALYDYDEDDYITDAKEPPVPPGLKKLTPALQSFVDVFDIDEALVKAAAEASPDIKSTAVDYHKLIAQMPRAECDDFLARLAEGEAGVAMALRKHLTASLPQSHSPRQEERRTFEELAERAEQLEKVEAQRQAEEARKKHIEEMQKLAPREAQIWQEVEGLLQGDKTAAVYDKATELLVKLSQLADYQNTPHVFQSRINKLVEKYSSRPALMRRWRSKGWV